MMTTYTHSLCRRRFNFSRVSSSPTGRVPAPYRGGWKSCLAVLMLIGFYPLGYLPAAEKPFISLTEEINVGASYGFPERSQYQCDLRCNPVNSIEMSITCKHENKNGMGEKETMLFHTVDGGLTWNNEVQQRSGDPDVVYDPNGNAHWSFIDEAISGHGYRRSLDGGFTWEATKNLDFVADHPHITCDRSNGPYRGTIYIAGRKGGAGKSLCVSRSRDGGNFFQTTLKSLSGTLGLGNVYGPAVLSDGTLLIPMITAVTILTDSRGVYAGGLRDIYSMRSIDGGVTFASPLKIGSKNGPLSAGAGGSMALGGFVSGPWGNGQRVYLTYCQELAQQPAALMLITSDDGGQTWSAPRAIIPSLPSGWGPGSSSVMVNKDGVVGIQFYASGTIGGAFSIYLTASIDGGQTFMEPVCIPSANSKPPPNECRVPGQDQVYGDAAADGSFRLVWTDSRNDAPGYVLFHRTAWVQSQTITAPTALKVVNGFGGGTYEKNTRVALTAVPAPAGQEFDHWTATTGLTVEEPGKAITAVTISTGGTVTAVYRPQILYPLTVANGKGDGNYPVGTLVTITGDTPPTGYRFNGWSGPSGVGMMNPKKKKTQVWMPAKAVTLTATYSPL